MAGVLAALVLLLAQGQDCPHCVVRNGRTALCEEHAAEERRVLSAEKNRLRFATDEGDRLAALRKIARLTERHTRTPSPKVAEALALGLADSSFAVKLEAVRVLGTGQQPQTALDALVAAAPGVAKLWDDVKLPPQAGQPDLNDARQLKKLQAELGKREDAGDLLQRQEYYENLVTALTGFHDARAEQAVLDMQQGAVTLKVAEAVVSFDSRRSTAKVVDWLATYEVRAAQGPKDEDSQAFVAQMSARLRELARNHGLPPPPAPKAGERASKLWRAWLREHGSALPESAGPGAGR